MANGTARSATIAVCVPVRDEAVLLPRFLDALAAQDRHDFTLCVLLDGCTDDSADIVAQRAATSPFRVHTAQADGSAPNAGRARRQAMTLGLAVLDDDAATIVSTDADSAPDPDWLSANATALVRADVVAGRIVRAGPPSAVQDRVEAYYDALFALRRVIDPVPWEARATHHYTSGASLAFRVAAYRALGGFAPIASAEDAQMVDAAHRAGLRVRRDAAVRVATSARRVGRADGGLAGHLRRLDRGGALPTMAHPDDMIWRYQRHAAARAAWPRLGERQSALAEALGCDVARVDRVAADAVNAEAFAMRVVPDVPGGERIVALDIAEAALDRWRRSRERAA